MKLSDNIQFKKFHPTSRQMHPRQANLDDSQFDLGRYIGGGHQDQQINDHISHRKNLHSEELHMQVNRINSKLQSSYRERIGDLTGASAREIQKTLQLVETLIGEIKKLQSDKNKVMSEKKQLDSTLILKEQQIERLMKDKKSLENQKEMISSKIKSIQKSSKDTVEKIFAEKQQMSRQLKQIQAREKVFEAEHRKKDQNIAVLTEKFSKLQQNKDKANVLKNPLEVLQKFESRPVIYEMMSTNSENQYGRLARDSRDDMVKRLIDENQYLKESLIDIQKHLNSVLQLKKESLKNKKGYDGEYENYFQLNIFRPEVLNLSEHWSRDKLKQLNENVLKFKQAIRLGDQAESRIEERKQGCVKGIKQILTNYKKVIDTQNQLLNKVVAKSNEFKSNQIGQLQYKFSRTLDSTDIERSKRFLQEQSQYLQIKNQELEKTKKIMDAVMQRAKQKKEQAMRQKQAFQKDALEMRRNLEILPAVIEDQISKALN